MLYRALLLFVAALVASGWYASRDEAAPWAPVLPTLVIAAGVIAGLVYAIRWGLRRRRELAAVAARMGFRFDNQRRELRDSGIGVLKRFAHCRALDELPLLRRGVRTDFANVMSSRVGEAEVFLFD